MEIGLIGLPLCGKTTIFSALSGQSPAPAGRKPHLAEVQVPDERVEKLTAFFGKEKKIHVTVLLKDLPIEFNEKGGLSPAALAEIRGSDALAVVLRAFLDEAVPHPLESIDPPRDLRRLLDSLIFSDYQIIENRLDRLVKEGKKDSREFQLLEHLSERLGSGSLIGRGALKEEGEAALTGFRFLTVKPLIMVVNSGERSAGTAGIREQAQKLGVDLFEILGRQEMEIAQLAPEDQKDFLADLGLEEPARNRFLRQLYRSLDLISFLTVGDHEVRAWSIHSGSSALKAAGRVHSDMEKGFIRAEVISCSELLAEGGFAQAKKHGKLRLEGKEYPVRDGDVLTVRFNL